MGAQRPLGFWDPIGLVENVDQERFDRLREVEIKHGRISMLAVLGHVITSSGIRWPGAAGVDGLKFADIPSGLAAFTKLPPGYIFWFVALVGPLELCCGIISPRSRSCKSAELSSTTGVLL